MSDLYICANCKQVFVKGRSDEEAQMEAKNLFPDRDATEIVCEDCFVRIMDYNEPGKKRYKDWVKVKG